MLRVSEAKPAMRYQTKFVINKLWFNKPTKNLRQSELLAESYDKNCKFE